MASIQKECLGMQAMITLKLTNGTDQVSTCTGGMISIRLIARDGKNFHAAEHRFFESRSTEDFKVSFCKIRKDLKSVNILAQIAH